MDYTFCMFRAFAVALAFLLFLPAATSAQGRVTGVVKDAEGRAIKGASITAESPNWAATTAACDGLLVVKLWTALDVLVTPLAASIAVALQKNVVLTAKSVVGMNPVSLMPSATVAVATSGLNAEFEAISNR